MAALTRLRILFLGMNGPFAWPPFQALLKSRHRLVGLGLPRPGSRAGPPRGLPFTPQEEPEGIQLITPPQPSLVQHARAVAVPVYELGDMRHPEALMLLERLRPDLVCVACFPRLLPQAWFTFPSLGALNVHPSLLPAYRGPEPLFWQLRAGEANTGVTLHHIDAGIDTGDIVSQALVPLPDGVTESQALLSLAQEGGRLLLAALDSPGELPHLPQDPKNASYQPFPATADRLIPTTWPARRAFNFIRGAQAWAPFTVLAGETRFTVAQALAFDPQGTLGSPYLQKDQRLLIQFSPGVLTVEQR